MAATNYFYSLQTPTGPLTYNNLTVGTSTTATNYIELRVMTVKADGTTATNVQKLDVRMALKHILHYIESSGLDHNGTNMPVI